MATIRKHRGKFQAIVRRKGYPPKSKTFTRRADAVAWASITESEMERGEFVDRTEADRTTLHDALEKYAETVTPRKKGARQELVRIRYWQRHSLSKTAMSRLRASDIASWRDDDLKTKAAATVNNHLILLSHLFNHARKEWGLPIRNPVEDIWRPKLPAGRNRRLRDGEEAKLLEAAAEIHLLFPHLVTFAIETAMRQGEIVRMERRFVRGHVVHLPDTKNDTTRDVPLSTQARSALAKLPKYINGKVWPWAGNTVSHMFIETCRKAEIEDLTFHDLRHEATSRLAKIYPVHELARITGHKTLQMLLRYYHPTADELAERLSKSGK